MNYSELAHEIKNILVKPDGRYNQTRVIWPYKELINEIEKQTSFLPEEQNLTTRIWYIVNNRTSIRCCNYCGKLLVTNVKSLNYEQKDVCLSKECIDKQRKETLFTKYGNDYYEKWIKKVEKTNISRYGVSNAMDNETVKQKQKTRAQENVSQNGKSIKRKREQTVKEKYGVTNVGQLPDHDYKMKKTSFVKYGAKSYSSTSECKEKVHNYWLNLSTDKKVERTGKTKQSIYRKYGVYSVASIPSVIKSRRSRYFYNNIFFDSSYELIYYLWSKDNGNNIRRCYNSYSYIVEGVVHYYTPDFIENDKLVEIKGEHFFDKNGNLINPFSNDEYVNKIFNEKGRFMNSLGVIVITDISSMMEYVNNIYGKDYIKSFRYISGGDKHNT